MEHISQPLMKIVEDMTPNGKGGKRHWVYFVRSGGLIKIGYTTNIPEERLRTLQTGCPDELELIGVIRGGRSTEAMIHTELAEFHYRGEWFAITEQAIRSRIPAYQSLDEWRSEVAKELQCMLNHPGEGLL